MLPEAQTRVTNPNDCDFGVWTKNDWILKTMDVPTPDPDAQPTADYWRPDGWRLGEKRTFNADAFTNLKVLFDYSLGSVMTDANAGQLGFTAKANDTESSKWKVSSNERTKIF
jgi:hypothetical protein